MKADRVFALRALAKAAPYLLSEEALIDALRLASAPPPTATECRGLLELLERDGLLTAVRNEVTTALRYRITDAGRAALADL